MKATRNTPLLWAAAAVLLTAGIAGVSCTKGNPDPFQRGSVRFMASLSTSATRTIYSGEGETNGSGQMLTERIDWTDGDPIRVYSPQAVQTDGSTHVADYAVESHETVGSSGSALTSRAVVVPAAGSTDLFWVDDNTHDFFAVYPSPATAGFTTGHTLADDGVVFAPQTAGSSTVMTFTGLIPAGQTVARKGTTGNVWLPDMRPAYMLAKASFTKSEVDEDGINLQFSPKFSAFEFIVSAGEYPSVTLTSFSLTSTTGSLTGAFTIRDGADDSSADWFGPTTEGIANADITGGGNTITVDFGSEGITITNAIPLSLTVLALPQEVSGLTVSFTGVEIGTRTLNLTTTGGTPLAWPPYLKHHIHGMSFPTFADVVIMEQITWNGEYYSDAILDSITWLPNSTGDAVIPGGDAVSWAGDGTIAGMYLTRGYLTRNPVSSVDPAQMSLSGTDQLEVLSYYGTDPNSVGKEFYFDWTDLGRIMTWDSGFDGLTTGFGDAVLTIDGMTYRVPSKEDWAKMITGNRPGSTVNGTEGRRYSKVKVNLSGSSYSGEINGLLIYPDCGTFTTTATNFDTPAADFSEIPYAEYCSLCDDPTGCVFLPCAGFHSGSDWSDGNAYGDFWSSSLDTNPAGLTFHSGNVIPDAGNDMASLFPVRLIRE